MEEESVRVIVRIRPLIACEDDGEADGRSSFDWDKRRISVCRPKKGTSEFKFSHILGPESTQQDLFVQCMDVARNVCLGMNCCIMAYGQTGSGKTYSMLGKGWDDADNANPDFSNTAEFPSNSVNDNENYGIIPRCVTDLFSWLQENANGEGCEYTVRKFLNIFYNIFQISFI